MAIGPSISATGSYFGAKESSKATQAAADESAQVEREALAQQKELSQPYRDFGQQSLGQLSSLLGLNGADPTASLRATPGYQFALNQGLQATTNQATAMGMGLSGNTLEALNKFSTGLADQTYQSAVGNAEYGATLGQAAAAGQAANIGSNANSLAGIYTNQGNTQAGIYSNLAAALANSGQQVTQNANQVGGTIAGLFMF